MATNTSTNSSPESNLQTGGSDPMALMNAVIQNNFQLLEWFLQLHQLLKQVFFLHKRCEGGCCWKNAATV